MDIQKYKANFAFNGGCRAFHLLSAAVCAFMLVSLCFIPCALAANDEEGGVTFNFVDVDLAAVAKFISDVTGKNFIFDERVRGKITIIAPSRLDPDVAFNLFTSVLRLKGFTLLPSGVNAYKIVPLSEATDSGMGLDGRGRPRDETLTARLIPLQNISSEDALKFLKPVVSKTGHIASFEPGNLLLVIDSGLNVRKVLDIVKTIDTPPLGEDAEVVLLEHSSAESVADILNKGVEKGGRRVKGETANIAVADKRLNAVVLFGEKSQKDSMKRLVSMLDVPPRKTQSTVNVYFLENADAEELAEVLDTLLKGEKTTARKDKKPGEAVSPFESAAGISITPDKATNSLVIIASPSDFQSLSEVISKLDRRRRQVYVEAMIVEASLDKLKDLGSQWRASATHDGEPVLIGGVGSIDSSAMDSILYGLSGFNLGGLGNFLEIPVTNDDGETTELTVPGFAALFNWSEFDGVVNVLSSPQILTSDNTEAEIVVGENVPFVSQFDVTDDDSVYSSVERKDVGITLKITPQVTEGDYVKLEIYQEMSAVEEIEANSYYESVGPTTTMRSTSTTIVVRDNQTAVIGGLMQEKEEKSSTGVPILSKIPLLGWLFKYESNSKEKTNLMVFLTPHIIRDAIDLAAITRDKENKFATASEMFTEGELFVKFRADVTEDRAIEIISKKRCVFVEFMEGPRHYRIRLPGDIDVTSGAKLFTSLPEVVYAKPNYAMPDMSLYTSSAAFKGRGGHAEGQLLVKFQKGVTAGKAMEIIDGQGCTVIKHYEGLDLYLVRLPRGMSVDEGVAAFSLIGEVQYSEPNYSMSIDDR